MTITHIQKVVILNFAKELRLKGYGEGVAVANGYDSKDRKIEEATQKLGELERYLELITEEPEFKLPDWFQTVAEKAREEFKNLSFDRVPAWARDAWESMQDKTETPATDSKDADPVEVKDTDTPNFDTILDYTRGGQIQFIEKLTVKQARELYAEALSQQKDNTYRGQQISNLRNLLSNIVDRDPLT